MNFNRKRLDSLKRNPSTESEVKDTRKAYRRIFEKLTFRLLIFRIYY